MEYLIRYNHNGKEYEDYYVPTSPSCLSLEEHAYEALRGSLSKNNLQIEGSCLRNIDLFLNNKKIYSATTYTKGMEFILKDNEEYEE